MISVIYKKFGIKINAIWFCGDINKAIANSKADVIFFHGVDKNTLKNSLVNSQNTLISDLSESLEDLFKRLHKDCRKNINRAKKENLGCEIFEADALRQDPAILNSFRQEYETFTSVKGIPNTYNERAMEEYIEHGNVLLSRAFLGEKSFAQHIYVCDGKSARCLYTVSNFRTEGEDSNLVGRANKLLHWHDVEYFRSHKYQTLDWGGIRSFTTPNGIDRFKMQFGGAQKQYFNIIVGLSPFGRLAVLARKLKRG